jgi:hypothetical protein
MKQDIKDLQEKLFALQKIDNANEAGIKATKALHLAIDKMHGEEFLNEYIIKAGLLFKKYKDTKDLTNEMINITNLSSESAEIVHATNNQCFKEIWVREMGVPFELATNIISAVETYDDVLKEAYALIDSMKRSVQ